MIRHLAALLLLALTPSLFAATSGVVLSTLGDPVAEVEVSAFQPESQEEQRARLIQGRERPALATAITDKEGAFTLDVKSTGVLELIATREGFAPARTIALAGDDVTLELLTAKSAAGRVTANGKPVGGALVVAFLNGLAVWQTRTDAQGRYAIPDPRQWMSELAVIHPDYALHFDDGQMRAPTRDVVLGPGSAVAGTVVTVKGTAAANARILHSGWLLGTTDAEGRFSLRHAPSSATVLTARANGAGGDANRGKQDLVIRLGEPRSISGTVRDAAKRPLGGAVVAAMSRRGRLAFMTVTDEKGGYRIEGLDGEDYQVYVVAPPRLRFDVARAALSTSSVARSDFTATSETFLTGTVVDERRKPVAGATVQLSPAVAPPLYAFVKGGKPAARTKHDGRFEIAWRGNEGGAFHGRKMTFRLQASRRGFAIGLSEPIEAGTNPKPITLVMPDGVELNGVVTDDAGKPVAGAGIALMQEPPTASPLPLDAFLAGGYGQPYVETGADGKFSVRVNKLPHDVGIWKESYSGVRVASVVPGGEPMKIVLHSGAEIRGRVVQKGSAAPPAGLISVSGDDGAEMTADVAPDGTFVVPSLTPGDYTVVFMSMTGASSKEQRVKAPASDVMIELASPGRLRGVVFDDATGEPISVPYSVMHEFAIAPTRVDFEAGQPYELTLPEGDQAIVFRAAGYAPKTLNVTIKEGNDSSYSVKLRRARKVSGRVTDDAGAPIENAAVRIDDENFFDAGVQSSADGSFALHTAPQSTFKIEVSSERHVRAEVDVPAGLTDPRIAITLPRGLTANGRVVTSDGLPLENAQVSVLPSGGEYRVAATDRNGAFTFEGLAPGRHRFTARTEDLGASKPVEAEPSAAEIVITMPPSRGTGAVHGKVAGFRERGWQYGMVIADDATSNDGKQTTMIGRDGTFRFEKLQAGETELRAFGGVGSGASSGTSPALKVTVIAGGDVEANIAFRDDVVLRGTVTESGRPAKDRPVRFSGSDSGEWTTRTNEQGVYEIVGLEPGIYEVSVGEGLTPFQTRYHMKDSATFDMAIDRHLLRGRVVDAAGKGIHGAELIVNRAESQTREQTASTGTNGDFYAAVPAGDYVVTAAADGYLMTTQTVSVTRDVPSMMFTLGKGTALKVRLTDARTGRPLTGYVVARGDDGAIYSARNAKDGLHELPLTPGAYRVSASANGFATQSIRVNAGQDSEAALALTPGGKLLIHTDRASAELVKLVLPGGEEYVQCECNGIAEVRLTGTTTAMEHVAPGMYTLRVYDHRNVVQNSVPVTIVEGQSTVVDLRGRQ